MKFKNKKCGACANFNFNISEIIIENKKQTKIITFLMINKYIGT